ncbi:MAG TPA: NAD(P)-dependent oxidoreductase [Planctomycetota bacterium]|nr:NAD(P)-dependent oxidoreductase [Planctomycetota bacterium]
MPPHVDPGVIAITGATGLVGRHLADRFRRLGWEVRALVRDAARYPYRESGIRSFACDLPDRIDPRGLEGANALIHCAYMTRFTDLESARRVNDLGTRKVLEAGRAAGVETSVFLSSQSAHEQASSYYGRSKLELERLFHPARDLVFRSGLVLSRSGSGLFHRMCDMVRGARVIPLFGGGHQPLQTIHVEDLAAAVEAAVRRGLTGLFTVAEPEAVAMKDFLRMIAARLGRRPLFVPFPMLPALLFLRGVELLRIPFPVSSENLLGLECLRASETRGQLAALGVNVRSAADSLDDVLSGKDGTSP